MSDEARRFRTEEDRDGFHLARRNGGICAACGRVLDAGETAYVEPSAVGARRPVCPGLKGSPILASAPVGVECTSEELQDDA
jgi:hypothetical protein